MLYDFKGCLQMKTHTQTSIPKPGSRLGVIGKKIDALDRLLVHLLAMRQIMSAEVGMVKIEEDLPIYNKEKEIQRLQNVTDQAGMEGVDLDFIRGVIASVINQSCKIQTIQRDDFMQGGKAEKFNPTHEELRENLMELTATWSTRYDKDYGEAHPATKALRDYEHKVIDIAVKHAPDREFLLDLGCATGIESRRLQREFNKLQGFDISDQMIRVGLGILDFDRVSNIDLKVCDIETGIPLEDSSVSMVIMNGGTGSDMSDFDFVLREIRRVLKPHGTFVISFYNKEAWIHRMFFPWPLGLMAGVDLDRNCLEVKVGTRRIAVYAKAYSVSEIVDMFDQNSMVLNSYVTYPTIASILPAEMVSPPKLPEITKVIGSLDEVIANGSEPLGAYIVVSGRKE